MTNYQVIQKWTPKWESKQQNWLISVSHTVTVVPSIREGGGGWCLAGGSGLVKTVVINTRPRGTDLGLRLHPPHCQAGFENRLESCSENFT